MVLEKEMKDDFLDYFKTYNIVGTPSARPQLTRPPSTPCIIAPTFTDPLTEPLTHPVCASIVSIFRGHLLTSRNASKHVTNYKVYRHYAFVN